MANRAASPQPQFITSGPWASVYNSSDSSDAYQTTLYSAANMYKPQGANAFQMRPPFTLKKAAGVLGSAGFRFGDCLFEHVAENGTTYRFVFVGGKVYRWDGNVTFTDVTPATPAISSPTPGVFACSFADNLVVSDGVHRPWYVPSSGCGATPLVATQIDIDGAGTAWTAQGAPVVYDARLFFILSSLGGVGGFQDTILWSEVANPALGYKQIAAGYADFWELFQTDTRPIYALAATELSLVVLRAQSILNITGKTDQMFVTNATRESIEGVGTRTPRSVLVQDGTVWFLDEQFRQYRYRPGETPEPLWPQLADTVNASLTGSCALQSGASICYHSDLNLILSTAYGAPASVGTVLGSSTIHVFDATTGKYQGVWDIDFSRVVHCLAVMRDSSTRPTLCALGESVTFTNNGWTLATSGQMWTQRRVMEMTGAVDYADPSGIPSASVTTHHLGRTEEAEWHFDQLTLRATSNNSTDPPGTISLNRYIGLTYYTPRGASTPPTAPLSAIPPQPVNTAFGAATIGASRAVWGLGPNAQGRWLMANVSCPTTTSRVQPFTPIAIDLRGIVTRVSPDAP